MALALMLVANSAPAEPARQMRRLLLSMTSVCRGAPRSTLFVVLRQAFNWSSAVPELVALDVTLTTNNASCLAPHVTPMGLSTFHQLPPPPELRVRIRVVEAAIDPRNPYSLMQVHYAEWNATLREERRLPDFFIALEDDIVLTPVALAAWQRDTRLLDAAGLSAHGFSRNFFRVETRGGRQTLADIKSVTRIGEATRLGCNASACAGAGEACAQEPLVSVREGADWRQFLSPDTSYSGCSIFTPDELRGYIAWRRGRLRHARYGVPEFSMCAPAGRARPCLRSLCAPSALHSARYLAVYGLSRPPVGLQVRQPILQRRDAAAAASESRTSNPPQQRAAGVAHAMRPAGEIPSTSLARRPEWMSRPPNEWSARGRHGATFTRSTPCTAAQTVPNLAGTARQTFARSSLWRTTRAAARTSTSARACCRT